MRYESFELPEEHSSGVTVNPFEVEVWMYFDLKRIAWKSSDRIAGQSGKQLAVKK